jgi:transposase InsO family protein
MFLEENIMSRFGCPRNILANNAQVFRSTKLVNLCSNYNIKFSHSTPYYPQGNGLVEYSNKILVRIIKNILIKNKKNWDSKLKYALWDDRICTKKSIGTSPILVGVWEISCFFNVVMSTCYEIATRIIGGS